jgi:hypothetical protein
VLRARAGRIGGGSAAVTIVGAVGLMGWLAEPDDWLIRELSRSWAETRFRTTTNSL